MKARKTVDVSYLISEANGFFQLSSCPPESRKMVQMFVEKVLMDHGAYKGFGYIDGWPCEDDSRIFFYGNK